MRRRSAGEYLGGGVEAGTGGPQRPLLRTGRALVAGGTDADTYPPGVERGAGSRDLFAYPVLADLAQSLEAAVHTAGAARLMLGDWSAGVNVFLFPLCSAAAMVFGADGGRERGVSHSSEPGFGRGS